MLDVPKPGETTEIAVIPRVSRKPATTAWPSALRDPDFLAQILRGTATHQPGDVNTDRMMKTRMPDLQAPLRRKSLAEH